MNQPIRRVGRVTTHLQDILAVLLEDPERDVWMYYLDQRLGRRHTNGPTLRKLALYGWLTVRDESAASGGRTMRRVYRLTPEGQRLAREALATKPSDTTGTT